MINLDLVYSLAHLEAKPVDSIDFSWVPWAVKSMVSIPMGPIPLRTIFNSREPS